jgi:hypothetical protein
VAGIEGKESKSIIVLHAPLHGGMCFSFPPLPAQAGQPPEVNPFRVCADGDLNSIFCSRDPLRYVQQPQTTGEARTNQERPGAARSNQEQPGATRSIQEQPAAATPGCCLVAPGCSWVVLGAPGCFWVLLGAPGMLLDSAGCSWVVLWCLWVLLGASGCS